MSRQRFGLGGNRIVMVSIRVSVHPKPPDTSRLLRSMHPRSEPALSPWEAAVSNSEKGAGI